MNTARAERRRSRRDRAPNNILSQELVAAWCVYHTFVVEECKIDQAIVIVIMRLEYCGLTLIVLL